MLGNVSKCVLFYPCSEDEHEDVDHPDDDPVEHDGCYERVSTERRREKEKRE